MKPDFLHIVRRSVTHNRSGFVQIALIIIVLTAVITGSLMTGDSVRKSLRKTSLEKLGNTGLVISSGVRYFDPSLTARMSLKLGVPCTGLLEINGSCQNFSTGQSVSGVTILGTSIDFFAFQGDSTIKVRKGEAAVNEKLAGYLGLKPGDDLIIHFSSLSEVPSNAPFSPDQGAAQSVALKVIRILTSEQSGDFSLGISQTFPLNVFVSRSDLPDRKGSDPKINRMLLEYGHGLTVDGVYREFKEILQPEDIGLNIKYVAKCSMFELTSERIFIDQPVIDIVKKAVPHSWPLITYLCNSFRLKGRSVPYSFISALPDSLYTGIPTGNEILINEWLAGDLRAVAGDTLELSWYSSDAMNHLIEKDTSLIIDGICSMHDIVSDSLLMPLFPGIAGRESCTGWDAGKYVNTELIRKKDEDYWNRYRGTPKAFIEYATGRKLWGNNFGPATAIRFSKGTTEDQIRSGLRGAIDPDRTGFVISDNRKDAGKAAREGVDFSTLLMSLGFFMIISSVLLLVLVISAFHDSKKEQITTFYALGFTNSWIKKFILTDSMAIGFTGAIAGAFSGWLFNMLIIRALNSVWQGAVQTRALDPHFNPLLILSGFLITVTIVYLILWIKTKLLLRNFYRKKSEEIKIPSSRLNLAILLISTACTISLVSLSFLSSGSKVIYSFSAGVMLFISLILLARQLYLRPFGKRTGQIRTRSQLSSVYYSFSSSQAVTPAIFIAAGLFAVVITGVNRLSINESNLGRKGGTGGYVLWGESVVPVRDDLNNAGVRRDFGLDDKEMGDIRFIQCLKSPGNDASCLNLNHVTAPPLLGLDPADFLKNGAFTFATHMKGTDTNPWSLIRKPPVNNTIYGVADQTVLEYGLKIKTGDTIKLRSESGQILNIVIAGGLRSSVFQGYVITGRENLSHFFPSVAGSQLFLADGNPERSAIYLNTLNDRLSTFSAHFEPASDRLASFFVVTNTYLSVFSVLGGIGMILGVIGLGIIMVRNFSHRKKEYGIMMATGFSLKDIRRMIFMEQVKILMTGIFTGFVSAIISTLSSVDFSSGIPWKTILLMIAMIALTGIASSAIALRSVTKESLVSAVRKN